MYGYEFEGLRYDTGSKLGYLRATVEYALRRPDLGEEFRQYLQDPGPRLIGHAPPGLSAKPGAVGWFT